MGERRVGREDALTGERTASVRPGRRYRTRAGSRPRAAHRLYAHLAWPTLQRLPLLGPSRARSVEFQLVSCCRRLGVDPVAVTALPDRVHLVFRYPASLSTADLAHRIRDGAAEALVRRGQPAPWGCGYALASVSPAEVDGLARAVRSLHRAARRDPAASRHPAGGYGPV